MRDFEVLLAPCYGALERFVRYRIDGADGDDVLQEVLLTASQRLHLLRDEEKFKPWLITIARNKCRDYYRRKKPEEDVPLEEIAWLPVPSRVGAVEAVRETLEMLSESDREMLAVSYYEKLTQPEIARRLQVPLGTVKSRMYTAKQRFKSAYPYPPRSKGVFTLKNMPEVMPAYTITPSEEAPFSVKWEEVLGWFIVPRVGEKLKWAMYEFPERKRTTHVDMEATGKAKIHGLEGVEIKVLEYDPVPSEQIDAQNPVERTLMVQLTDNRCRILSESHTKQGVKEVYTFLDGDNFTKNWGLGPNNDGYDINLSPRGIIKRDGDVVTTVGKEWPLDIVGRYTVTIGNRSFDTVCIMDVEAYDNGIVAEQYVDREGRTVLWRRFNPEDWAYHFFKELWTEKLPENERMYANGKTCVHWYDCITDYVL